MGKQKVTYKKKTRQKKSKNNKRCPSCGKFK